MSAPARRRNAAMSASASRETHGLELWQEAVQIRQGWLYHGLSAQPADRATAESGITNIYARISRPRPRFEWVDSPYKAGPLIVGLPTLDQLHQWILTPPPLHTSPLASDLVVVASRLRGALSDGVVHTDPELSPVRRPKTKDPWPDLPPLEALAWGVPLGVVLHQGIRVALHRSLVTGFCVRVRSALGGQASVPVCWYGQQDAPWVGYYDALHRLGLAHYGSDETDHLGDWAALVRSCGWWWPGERVCVVVDRPALLHTEPVPGTWHDEVRLMANGVEYRDGWRPPLT
jgi:hypothetical protein